MQGEIAYRSPEGLGLFDKPEEHLVGFPSDMWSVGCLLLELLTYQPALSNKEMRSKATQTQTEHTKERQLQWVSPTSVWLLRMQSFAWLELDVCAYE